MKTTKRTRSYRWFAAAVIAALAVAAFAWWYTSRSPVREAVVLIVVDTLRADRLSCYGYDKIETPAIDAVADRGVRFENAYSVGGWTVPSMGAVMTSLYPSQLGLVEAPRPTRPWFKPRERREQWEYSIAAEYTTMPEVFSAAGYHTVAFVNQPVLNNQPGFAQGFDDWFHPLSADTVEHRIKGVKGLDPGGGDQDAVWNDLYMADSVLVDAFVDWMPRARAEKLFVWVHLLTPHAPYSPPARFGVPRTARDSDRYDAEVRYADEMVGRIVDAIDDHVGLEHTTLVFTADHGEEFHEHGGKDHGHSLHRECIHVPLVVAAPQWPRGGTVDDTVRLIDVFPTLVSLCGVDSVAAEARGARDIEGTDLSPVVAGRDSDLDVYTEGMLYGPTERALLEGDLKLMWDEQADTTKLYQVREDPGEKTDVMAQFAAEASRLHSELDDFHQRLVSDRMRFLRESVIADSLSSVQERRRALNAMRSLGYIND